MNLSKKQPDTTQIASPLKIFEKLKVTMTSEKKQALQRETVQSILKKMNNGALTGQKQLVGPQNNNYNSTNAIYNGEQEVLTRLKNEPKGADLRIGYKQDSGQFNTNSQLIQQHAPAVNQTQQTQKPRQTHQLKQTLQLTPQQVGLKNNSFLQRIAQGENGDIRSSFDSHPDISGQSLSQRERGGSDRIAKIDLQKNQHTHQKNGTTSFLVQKDYYKQEQQNQQATVTTNLPSTADNLSSSYFQIFQASSLRKQLLSATKELSLNTPTLLPSSYTSGPANATTTITTSNSNSTKANSKPPIYSKTFNIEEKQISAPRSNHQILSSSMGSGGFQQVNNQFNRTLQSGGSSSKQLQSTKKLFSQTSIMNSQSRGWQLAQPELPKKSTSVQRTANKTSQSQTNLNNPPTKQYAALEYYAKQNNGRAKVNSETPLFEPSNKSLTTEEETQDFRDSFVSNQKIKQNMNKQEKFDLDKEAEDLFKDTIQKMNIDILKKISHPEDVIQVQNKMSSNKEIDSMKSSDNSSSSVKHLQYGFTESYTRSSAQKAIIEGVLSPTPFKKSESFRVPSPHSSSLRKSNSLNRKEGKRPGVVTQKPGIKNPQSVKKKSCESPSKPFSATLQKNSLTAILRGNTMNNSPQYQNNNSKEMSNKKSLENSIRALHNACNNLISNTNSRKSLVSASVQESPYQTKISSFCTQVKQLETTINPLDFQLHRSYSTAKQVNHNYPPNISSSSSSQDSPLIISQSEIDNKQNEQQQKKYYIETPLNTGFCYYNTSMDMHNRFPNPEDYFCSIFRDHFVHTFNSIHHMKQISQVDSLMLQALLVDLQPINPNKKTIIFDLDETLIHCVEDHNPEVDLIFPIEVDNGETCQAYVFVRPFARECLRELSKLFEIIVFTASLLQYAEKVLEYLDPKKQYVSYLLSRENCLILENGLHVKDLRILKGRDLKNVIIVDNAAYSFGFQLQNGVPIVPFYKNKQDRELYFLVDFLKKFVDKEDVRPILQRIFKLHQYADCASSVEALELIFKIKHESVQEQEEEVQEKEKEEEEYINPDNVSVHQPRPSISLRQSQFDESIDSQFEEGDCQNDNFQDQENPQIVGDKDSDFDLDRADYSEADIFECDQ